LPFLTNNGTIGLGFEAGQEVNPLGELPGEIIKEILLRHNLTYAQATLRTDRRVNRSYWSVLINGSQRPSYRVVELICEAFPTDADLLNALRAATGYPAPTPAPPPFAPGAAAVASDLQRIAEARGLQSHELLPVMIAEEKQRLGLEGGCS
jgi:transcriptional regulator with XRE-family HTH domain